MLTQSARYTMSERQQARRCFGCEKPFAASTLIRGYCKRCAARTKERFHCPNCNRDWVADWISIDWAIKCGIESEIKSCFNCEGLIPESESEGTMPFDWMTRIDRQMESDLLGEYLR